MGARYRSGLGLGSVSFSNNVIVHNEGVESLDHAGNIFQCNQTLSGFFKTSYTDTINNISHSLL